MAPAYSVNMGMMMKNCELNCVSLVDSFDSNAEFSERAGKSVGSDAFYTLDYEIQMAKEPKDCRLADSHLLLLHRA
jgi:hypothetical protein